MTRLEVVGGVDALDERVSWVGRLWRHVGRVEVDVSTSKYRVGLGNGGLRTGKLRREGEGRIPLRSTTVMLIPTPSLLADALPKLPPHLDLIVLSAIGFWLLSFLSSAISPRVSSTYRSLPLASKNSWNFKVVCEICSEIPCILGRQTG
jgi:hypothetical protein